MTDQNRRLFHESRQVELDLKDRQLLVHGSPVAIGERAFEILTLLVHSREQLVSKDQIIQRVWSGVPIGDNALEVHVSSIRKALGPERGLLKTAYGRGYRMLGRWDADARDRPHAGLDDGASQFLSPIRSNLPLPATAMIGRDADAVAVSTLLTKHRLVTLVGTGGIGKTRLGLAVAHRQATQYSDGVWFVELGTLSDAAMVPSAAAAALGIDISNGNTLETIARSIADKRLLVVLDTCEHVVEAATHLAEELLRRCPELRMLATSQEPLRADSEAVFSVMPLSVPGDDMSSQQIATSSAVQLFLARAAAATQSFPTDSKTIELVGLACRRLDGIPLALELAAARAVTLGMELLVARLDDRLQLLSGGRRTALPRHQTLRATLDWSYGLLPDNEQAQAAKHHARYLLDVFEQAEAEWGSRPSPDWLATYTIRFDDLNAALDWAFGPNGDSLLGARLASYSVPLWFQLARVPSGMARFERALSDVAGRRDEERAQLHLNAALGALGMFDPDFMHRREAAWRATLYLAQKPGDTAYELRALRALYASRGSDGDFRGMWPIAESFAAAASSDDRSLKSLTLTVFYKSDEQSP